MRTFFLLALCSHLLLTSATVQAQAPATISHQGVVEDASGPVTATLPLTFRLFNTASGGTALWTETHPSVSVADGLYAVALGSITSLSTFDFNRPLWLEVSVNGSLQTPRTALTGVPAAMTLRTPATITHGAAGSVLYLRHTASSGQETALTLESNSTSGRGLYSFVTPSSGTTYGIYGESQSTSGRGVYGHADASTGINYGVYGESDSEDGTGVYGTSPEVGVRGISTSSLIGGVGVWGEVAAPQGFAVQGSATATSGENAGVLGESFSSEGRGVRGIASSATGTNYGIYGESESSGGSAAGVYGTAARNGVIGVATGTGSSTAIGVAGSSSATSCWRGWCPTARCTAGCRRRRGGCTWR